MLANSKLALGQHLVVVCQIPDLGVHCDHTAIFSFHASVIQTAEQGEGGSLIDRICQYNTLSFNQSYNQLLINLSQ